MFTCLWIKILPRFMLWWCYICQTGRPTLLKIQRSVRFGFYSYCRKTCSSNVPKELLITFERNNCPTNVPGCDSAWIRERKKFFFSFNHHLIFILVLHWELYLRLIFANPVKHLYFFKNRKSWRLTVLQDLI